MKRLFALVLLVCIGARLIADSTVNNESLTPRGISFTSTNFKASHKQLISSIPVPQLGTSANFVLFTVNGAVGNTGISNITGNVGANIGAVTGFAGLNGTIYNADGVTAQCVTDLISAYNQISAITPTAVHGPILGGGETLYTGVYSMPGAGSAAGVLTLDAQGDPNAEFIFMIGGAFTTGAGTTVVLINGASASNVYWVAEGAISMAASTTMMGTLIANNAAISMGAGGILDGRMFSTTGAVSVYGDFISIPLSGFIWTGAVSTNWNTGANWRGGTVPTGADDCFIGINLAFTYFPNIPDSSGSVSVGSIAFGSLGGQASGVVVNTGSTLNVTRAITYQSDAGSSLGYICTLSGPGTINANSVNVIANTALAAPYDEILASSATNLNVLTNIALSSSNNGAVPLNAKFVLTGGTTLVTGLLQTTNTASGVSSFIILPATTATLQLSDTTVLHGLSAIGTNVITFNNTGAIVEYSGASQTVYTDAGITGLPGGVIYQNIKFSGNGIKTASTGNLNIAGDYTTTLVNDSGDYVNLANPAVNFNGTQQNLAAGAGNGTTFYAVTFSGAGTKTMTSGNFYVASPGVLTMVGSNTSTILAVGGLLTLRSDASGSASLAALASPGPAIIGNVNVERYLTGGSGHRGYRLLSSPVYGITDTLSNNLYSINYLKNSSYLTGTTGIPGGFDKAGNPTLYLFRENMAPLNASFTDGNFRGINTIGTAPNYNYLIDGDAGAFNIPVGNGFLFFFRGDRNVASLAAETSTTYVPTNTILTASGTLNTGQVLVKDWSTQASSNLEWTNGTLNTSVRGFNLVGNPYASAIDWETFQNASTTTGIYGSSIGMTIYLYDPVSHNYGAYTEGNYGIGTNNASNIISSGQGFFVLATCSCATLIFNEDAKTNTRVSGAGLLMGRPVDNANNQYIRLQLNMDSANTDNILLRFNRNAGTANASNANAPYFEGFGRVSLSSYSSDRVALAINTQPLPKTTATIGLKVTTLTDGVYWLNVKELVGIPPIFDIWLIDAYKDDSLDMRHNTRYTFNVIKSDTNSFGSHRFSLVIRQNPAYALHLLDFTAIKVTNGAQVAWTTVNEGNYTNFSVERSTDNGKTFAAIGSLASNGAGTYGLPDKNPLIGINQYRLKQEDLNGVISYSNVVTVMYANSNTLSNNTIIIYPNPATGAINLTILANRAVAKLDAGSYAITIMNSSGSIKQTATLPGASWHGNVSNLLPGTYLIRVVNSRDQSLVGESKFVKL